MKIRVYPLDKINLFVVVWFIIFFKIKTTKNPILLKIQFIPPPPREKKLLILFITPIINVLFAKGLYYLSLSDQYNLLNQKIIIN